MRKLFLSFTALLRLLSEDKVSFEDLRHGLFYFGCTRAHAYEPGSSGETDERQWSNGAYAVGHPMLVNMLRQAEIDGRADWRRTTDAPNRDPWEVLDDLLERNGHKRIKHARSLGWNAGYPAMADALAQAGIDVVPVF